MQDDSHQNTETVDPSTTDTPPPLKKLRRGFAAMDPTKVREYASKGGIAAHQAGTAHTWSTEGARAAGKKGGSAPHVSRGRKPKS
jgi:uncharacterized protein